MLKVLSPEEMKQAMEQSIPALLTEAKRKEYCITIEQEQNIRKLVVGLERLLPTHKHIFDMDAYALESRQAEEATIEHPCKTSACAVGYGPSCGIPFSKPHFGWVSYAYEKFGGENSNGHHSINDFMFSSNWEHDENQMEEAIARIKIVLAGKVPEEFDYVDSYI